jgi:antitoxin component of RelBE/YafQ-DinJ toxin-antitoxin module
VKGSPVTAQIHLRLDDDLKRDVDAYASNYGISINDAIRILLKNALAPPRSL